MNSRVGDLSDLYASIDDPKVKADIAHIKELSASLLGITKAGFRFG